MNRQNVCDDALYILDDGFQCEVITDKRVGIGYATPEDQNRPWRFKMVKSNRVIARALAPVAIRSL